MELLIVAILVKLSFLYVFKKVFPQTSFKIMHKIAMFCEKQKWHRLAQWLKPKAQMGCAGGCGCGSEPKVGSSQKNTQAQPVKWK